MNEHVRLIPALHHGGNGFSADDYSRLIESGVFSDMKVELVSGELRRMAPAYGNHGRANGNIYSDLREAYRGQAVWLAVDLAIRISNTEVCAADVVVAHARAPKDRLVEGSDLLLVVEVALTTLARDLGEKSKSYAEIGVPEYWVVDLANRVVHVMRQLVEVDYTDRSIIRFGESLPVPGTDRTITVD